MKPVIFGCAGPALSDAERSFFEAVQPAGFILFARNIISPQQLLTLTTDLKLCVDRSDVLIAIDQEGGRVQRMGPPEWRAYPAMKLFGDCAEKDKALAEKALAATCRLMSDDLRRMGINMNCAPVLDLPIDGSADIIDDRAYSNDLEVVSDLGRIAISCMEASGILPVIKHMPGHGRALVDSHKSLPRVTDAYQVLTETDFYPFRQLNHCPFAMTAHIVYEAVDPDLPATLSPKVIQQVIRQEIGYGGLVMTDDLSMHALEGSFATRAAKALGAGCDLVLHCNRDMQEMKEVAAAIPEAAQGLRQRIADLIRFVGNQPAQDREDLERDYESLIGHLHQQLEG